MNDDIIPEVSGAIPAFHYNLAFENVFFQDTKGASVGRSFLSGKNTFSKARISISIGAKPKQCSIKNENKKHSRQDFCKKNIQQNPKMGQ
ncbi:hypothetical protein [Flavobacterium arsenatis]|uniref:hypothetical protein n=1 Tax=Flavobacterium arsenatis TaxID=1484332 RepID=UPI00286B713D|nr:hypothetical protein [Flavobacterium arsenatis]